MKHTKEKKVITYFLALLFLFYLISNAANFIYNYNSFYLMFLVYASVFFLSLIFKKFFSMPKVGFYTYLGLFIYSSVVLIYTYLFEPSYATTFEYYLSFMFPVITFILLIFEYKRMKIQNKEINNSSNSV